MAAGREVLLGDLPPELLEQKTCAVETRVSWPQMLQQWAEKALVSGHQKILQQAVPEFERTVIDVALRHTGGRKKEAAELLGWGRNTLTRKLQEYQMEEG